MGPWFKCSRPSGSKVHCGPANISAVRFVVAVSYIVGPGVVVAPRNRTDVVLIQHVVKPFDPVELVVQCINFIVILFEKLRGKLEG